MTTSISNIASTPQYTNHEPKSEHKKKTTHLPKTIASPTSTPKKSNKPIEPHTPSPIPSPVRNAPLGTPEAYHFASWFDQHTSHTGTPDRTLRRTIKKMRNKKIHSVVVDSAEKDMAKIRRKRKTPDLQGRVVVSPSKVTSSNTVTSPSKVTLSTKAAFPNTAASPTQAKTTKRVYSVHKKISPNGKNKLFPISGPNVVSLNGKELATTLEQYQIRRARNPDTRYKDLLKSNEKV
jgi:hypothetical protein